MHVESSRFGTMEIRDDAVISFPDGLPGLPGERWALVGADEKSPFFWLHSIEDATMAIPVTSPWLFFGDYELRITDADAARLELSDAQDAFVICVVRAKPNLADFTINLASPIVINTPGRVGRQVLNDHGGYSVRHPLFSEVELSEVRPATATEVVATAG
jgi:flagellar assembly factor FliW